MTRRTLRLEWLIWPAVMLSALACSETNTGSEQGWVNLAVDAGQVRASASFTRFSQDCDVAEVSDCVVARCRPVAPQDRISGGVVTLSLDELEIPLDTKPGQAESDTFVSSTVAAAVEPGDQVVFNAPRTNTVPPVTRDLRVPGRMLVDQCAGSGQAPPLVAAGEELRLSWPEGASGELLLRLVPPGQFAEEPHVRPERVAICQVPAESPGFVVAARVTELFDESELELHADLVNLSVANLEQRRLAFSVSRDVCSDDL